VVLAGPFHRQVGEACSHHCRSPAEAKLAMAGEGRNGEEDQVSPMRLIRLAAFKSVVAS
jgi:hypothetical protein